MELLIDALLDWIAANSDYDTRSLPHPAVVALSPEGLTTEFYSGVSHLAPDDGVDERINAIFSHEDGDHGTIFILRPNHVDGADYFDDPTENPLFREILLHELVHYVQWQTGVSQDWDCLAIGETEAYHLGGIYLRQSRTTDPLPNRAFWARMYARC